MRRQTWAALIIAYEGCAVTDHEERRQARLCYAALAGAYLKIYEISELEARLAAVERQLALEGRPHATISLASRRR